MDNNSLNPKMITLARESRGLTQEELANKVSIEQGSISKIENGNIGASNEVLEAISRVLSYPINFFFQRAEIYPPDLIYFRKRASLPKKSSMQIMANLNLRRIQVQELSKSVELPQNYMFLDVESHGSPQNIARYVRQLWKLPAGPIQNLTQVIEKAGIIVISIPENDEKFDGMAYLTEDGQPLLYVNSSAPWDRQRFSLAHELGHLIMHLNRPPSMNTDVEAEADKFAAEFLMPESEIKPFLAKLDLYRLIDLKKYWKVSMAAIIYRAKDLKRITDYQYRGLNIQLSAAGYKKRELDLGILPEESTLLREIVKAHMDHLNYDADDIANLLLLEMKEFQNQFLEENKPKKLRIVT